MPGTRWAKYPFRQDRISAAPLGRIPPSRSAGQQLAVLDADLQEDEAVGRGEERHLAAPVLAAEYLFINGETMYIYIYIYIHVFLSALAWR